MSEASFESLRSVVVARFPDLARANFSWLPPGFDSLAMDVDDRLIFKFPRSESAAARLKVEAGLLAVIRPAVTMPLPDLAVYPGPPLFSRHTKLKGRHLLAADYAGLPKSARQDLADAMAHFYVELHSLDTGKIRAAGARPIPVWLSPEDILRRSWAVLPTELRSFAEQTIRSWQLLPPDPYGITYGFFDGHGWNMAFDHASRKLNGLYDFADSGFGPLHQEFIYSNFISTELTARIVGGYENATKRSLDRERIRTLTGAHRLFELADLADDPQHLPAMLESVLEWVASKPA
jgi:hypothetical protein